MRPALSRLCYALVGVGIFVALAVPAIQSRGCYGELRPVEGLEIGEEPGAVRFTPER